ncbi:COG2426 family protein [Natronospora cellulosivora (SeqCode)]
MDNLFFQWFNQYLSRELAVLIVSALPIVELRGAIPLAISLGFSPWKAYYLSVFGNILPIIPLLLFLVPVRDFLIRHFIVMENFFSRLEERTLKKSDRVEKYGAIALILFTAIPFPTTGAWTACLAAVLFKIKFKYAFPAITTGVFIAGIIMIILSVTGKAIF